MRRCLMALALALVAGGCAEKQPKFEPMPPEDSGADKKPVERPVAPPKQ
jgi:PBP1b-binding outer membrane lipoprotein LpoB